MLELRKNSIPDRIATYLNQLQQEIDQLPVYAERVEKAKASWNNKSSTKEGEEVFAQVREALQALCSGGGRCHYCENSTADEIEHVWPKTFFPEKAFRWDNYLYACGACNGTFKNDQFPLFDATGQVIAVSRRRNAPVVPPPAGDPVFLDPHQINPMDFMELDPETGLFVESGEPGQRGYERAAQTIAILGLNRRDDLKRARQAAFEYYRDSAEAYVREKAAGAAADELARRRRLLLDYPHVSVWFEIKRLAKQGVTRYRSIFDAAPELLEL